MRKPRELRDGARYHVSARANRKEMILDPHSMKELFLQVVGRAKAKYDFRIENFCIMGNHFHLIIRPGKGENLSAIMRWIMSVFAMSFNKIMNHTGHVWGERFFSRIISGLREFMKVFTYVDENPLRANRVHDPCNWRYGGLWHDQHGCHAIIDNHEGWVTLLFPNHQPFPLYLLN